MPETVEVRSAAQIAEQYRIEKNIKAREIVPKAALEVAPQITPSLLPESSPEPKVVVPPVEPAKPAPAKPNQFGYFEHKADEAPVGSGLFQSIESYLKPVEEPKPAEPVPAEPAQVPDPKVETPEVGIISKLEEMEKEQIITEFKKYHSESDTRVNNLQKEFDTFKSTSIPGEESDVLKDFEGLKTDFVGTYEKLKAKYGLPAMDIVRTQFTSSNNVTSRLQQYQETELKKTIEKEFTLEEGEFEFIPAEASKAGTASYRWDELSDQRKAKLISEQEKIGQQEVNRTNKAQEQQELDITWYADTYYNKDTDKVNGLLDGMNEVMGSVAKGKEGYEKHPFAIRNLLRGFYFDELAGDMVNSAITELTAKFASAGIRVPSNGESELPTDVTKVGGSSVEAHHSIIDEKAAKLSPMLGSLKMSLKNS